MNPFYDPAQWTFALLTGIIASSIVAIVVLFAQYGGSSAYQFTNRVARATREIRANWSEAIVSGQSLTALTGKEALLRNMHRQHLSVFIERMIKAFGAQQVSPTRFEGHEVLPCLILIQKDESGNTMDRWTNFQLYAAHLVASMQEFHFFRLLRVHHVFPAYRRTLLLIALLECIERVTGAHDGVMDTPSARDTVAHYADSHGHAPEYFWLGNEGHAAVHGLIIEMEELRQAWFAWESSIG
ncbi:MAG: hypothetical protein IPK70_06620 [Flavobacteriales bacterium]|nr:hypothetical protein [Flavobacteriales bacterium]